ncbi:hypothetical protein D3C81_1652670 [compost metagenome]
MLHRPLGLHHAGVQPCQVKQLGEQAVERLYALLHALHVLLAQWVAFTVLERVDEQCQRMQRLAQVVAGHGQQTGFRFAQCLQLCVLVHQLGGCRIDARLQVLPALQ